MGPEREMAVEESQVHQVTARRSPAPMNDIAAHMQYTEQVSRKRNENATTREMGEKPRSTKDKRKPPRKGQRPAKETFRWAVGKQFAVETGLMFQRITTVKSGWA